ncbi:mitochondrial RNA pseudouridine synthase rpusd4 [Nematolebias whitei]|uniref:mitochondrial RNA pseudouridine synthase rpusd4 n=1 Tax=Nematolebias whitei TaxID=451745 RepID=UPI001896BE45|nr:mitochondrial RNA pseudouridine synthase rpusd4 [Nematolebias whitei]
MNACKRLVSLGERTFTQNIFFSVVKSRTNGQEASLGRSQSTAAHRSQDSDTTVTGEKLGLRAIDLAQKVQQEKAKTRAAAKPPPVSGSEGRVAELKRFSLQLQNVHPNVLAKHLHKSVLYRDKDVVIINKPYGVPVREIPGVTSISSVLPVLSKMMAGTNLKTDSQLFPCMSLEKDSTGTLLLATSEETVEHILNLNKNNQVQRKYWVVTVGVPVPSEGLIDIPMLEKEITGSQPHYKMALSPCFKMNDTGDGLSKIRGHRQADPATTRYKVLDSSSGCSLIELQPYTGVKHQLRVHMAFALACPILGDHKYSHWSKLAPQKLPKQVLKKLGLEQSKSRHIPLHLHERQLTLPRPDQENIVVSCPLPKYFMQTLKRLQLTFQHDEDNK